MSPVETLVTRIKVGSSHQRPVWQLIKISTCSLSNKHEQISDTEETWWPVYPLNHCKSSDQEEQSNVFKYSFYQSKTLILVANDLDPGRKWPWSRSQMTLIPVADDLDPGRRRPWSRPQTTLIRAADDLDRGHKGSWSRSQMTLIPVTNASK